MRSVDAACALLLVGAVLGTPATAGAAKTWAPCAMTDPPGDVRMDGDGPIVSADHVDLRSVSLTVGRKDLTVVFRNTAGDHNRLGEWAVTFTAGRNTLFVVASLGAWIAVGNDPDTGSGYRAGVVGGKSGVGPDTVGPDGTVTATVPLTTFGAAAPRKGTVLSGFVAHAMEKFVTTGSTMIGPADYGSWPYRFTVGGGCRLT